MGANAALRTSSDALVRHAASTASIPQIKWMRMLADASFYSVLLRDIFIGPVRFYTESHGLSVLWFVPDILSVVYIIMAIPTLLSSKFILAVASGGALLAIALLIGYSTAGSGSAVGIGTKMVLPLVLGMFLSMNTAFEPKKRKFFLIILPIYVFFIFYSNYHDFPWTDFQFQSLGVDRYTARITHIDGASRVTGLASDNHMAGCMALILLMLAINPERPFLAAVFLAPVALAIDLTTSRTSIFALVAFVLQFTYMIMTRKIRAVAALGNIPYHIFFLAPLIIFILSIVFIKGLPESYFDNTWLESYWIRANITWIDPFNFLSDQFPMGFFFGAGFGPTGLAAQATSFSTRYVLGLDNFFLGIYMIAGIPGLFYLITVYFNRFRKSYHYVVLGTLMVFGSTIQGFGTASFCMLSGMCMSALYSRSPKMQG